MLTMLVSPSNSGTTTPTTGWQNASATLTISASANTGYAFSSWSGTGSGSYSGTNNPATNGVTMNAAITETATFTQDEYVLTVNVVGSGSVARVPDQVSYHLGDSVLLTANPIAGWSFSAWSGGLSGSTNPRTIIINGTTTITATFTQDEYTVVVAAASAYHGARLSWSWSSAADSWNIYWSLNSGMSGKVLLNLTPISGNVFSNDTNDLPSNAWNQTIYYQIVPVLSGVESLPNAGIASALAAPMEIKPVSVEVLVSNENEIRVRLNYTLVNFASISSGVQVAELLAGTSPPTPIVVLVTSPINLPNYNSTGYIMIDYTPASPLAHGHYQVWFFIWDAMLSEQDGGHPYMTKVIVDITI